MEKTNQLSVVGFSSTLEFGAFNSPIPLGSKQMDIQESTKKNGFQGKTTPLVLVFFGIESRKIRSQVTSFPRSRGSRLHCIPFVSIVKQYLSKSETKGKKRENNKNQVKKNKYLKENILNEIQTRFGIRILAFVLDSYVEYLEIWTESERLKSDLKRETLEF